MGVKPRTWVSTMTLLDPELKNFVYKFQVIICLCKIFSTVKIKLPEAKFRRGTLSLPST
jgi:hypothetical protein